MANEPFSPAQSKIAPLRSIQTFSADLPMDPDQLGKIRVADGWRDPVAGSLGYRHLYDPEIAEGGLEFHQLSRGLWLLTTDIIPARAMDRRHHFDDKIVLSAVLKGKVDILEDGRSAGQLTAGQCTIYGMSGADVPFETCYAPGEPLQWVTIVMDRGIIGEVTHLSMADLPEGLHAFMRGERAFPFSNVPLSRAAALAAQQVLETTLTGGYRRTFLAAKAREIACLALFSLKSAARDTLDGVQLQVGDHARIELARRYLERSLDEPPQIDELAQAVGMTRQKLQLGFKKIYGDTVANVRDQMRIGHALELVRISSMSMIEIALETGYEHPASFTRAFRAAFGMSPSQMRKMSQEAALAGRLMS